MAKEKRKKKKKKKILNAVTWADLHRHGLKAAALTLGLVIHNHWTVALGGALSAAPLPHLHHHSL